ncbi:MAG: hypothetical protein ABW189_05665 [Rickettsiales bacterium]
MYRKGHAQERGSFDKIRIGGASSFAPFFLPFSSKKTAIKKTMRMRRGATPKRRRCGGRANLMDAQTKKSLKEKLQAFFGHQNPSLKAEDPFEEVTENGKKYCKAKFNIFARSDNNA